MLGPSLIIGLGGAGGSVLHHAAAALDDRLRAAGWEGGVPDAVRFLHIDCAAAPDVVSAELQIVPQTPVSYLGMSVRHTLLRDYEEQLANRAGAVEALASWRPTDRYARHILPERGAGQMRAAGRIVTLVGIDRVRQVIAEEFFALGHPGTRQQLAAANDALGALHPGPGPHRVIVVCSLAGGTGAGALLDVVAEVKSVRDPVGDASIFTVLVTPNAFDEISVREGMEPNALATLSELLASESEGCIEGAEAALTGLPVGSAVGPDVNFFVGSRSGAVALEHHGDVIRIAGAAIGSMLIDDRLLEVAHFPPLVLAPDSFPFADQGRASALGYASVSLGRKRFEAYASERLARAALTRLLDGHLEFVAQPRAAPADVAVAQVADGLSPAFVHRCRLGEPEELASSLRSPDEESELGRLYPDLRGQLHADPQGAATREAFRAWLDGLFAGQVQPLLDRLMAEQAGRVSLAGHDIQSALGEQVASGAGDYGLPVAARLVEDLAAHVARGDEELRRQQQRFVHESRALFERAVTSLEDARAHLHQEVAGSVVRRAVEDILRASAAVLKAHRRGLAAELLRDLVPNVLEPLRVALVTAEHTLRDVRNPEIRRMVEGWSGQALAQRLEPSPTEFVLESLSEFPDRFDALLVATFDSTGALAPAAAQSSAVAEVIRGQWGGNHELRAPGALVTAGRSWTSSDDGPAAFSVELDPAVLLSRAAAWVTGREGPVRDHVRESLGEWLAQDPVHLARVAQFASALQLAAQAAAPLATIDQNIACALHHAPAQVVSFTSAIPVGADHPAHGDVLAALAAAGDLHPAEAVEPAPRTDLFEITSMLHQRVHPLVLSSLTEPMRAAWAACDGPGDRELFWAGRRARPVPSFVPLSRGRQLALIKGWLVAALIFDQVRPLAGLPWDALPDIWTPYGRRAFPRTVLGPGIRSGLDVLPALFESFPLALLDFAAGDRSAAEAYSRLIELGSRAGRLGTSVSLELAQWIADGEPSPLISGDEPAPTPQYAGPADGTARQRAEVIEARLTATAGHRVEVLADPVTAATSPPEARHRELRPLLAEALEELIAGIWQEVRQQEERLTV